MRSREPCPMCGTWRCDVCGWKRTPANLRWLAQVCRRCGSDHGEFLPIHHDQRRHDDHVEELTWWTAHDLSEGVS